MKKGAGIQLNLETGDIEINPVRNNAGLITGGLVIGDTTRQNQAILVYMHAGELKNHPTTGAGISHMLNDSEITAFKHRVRDQLTRDGQTVHYLQMKQNPGNKTDIQLNANY